MTKIKDFLIKYSNNYFFIGICFGFLSLSWIDWNDSFLSFIDIFDVIRYIVVAVFLGLRFVSLLFINKRYFLSCLFIFSILLISFIFCKTVYLIQCIVIMLLSYRIDLKKIIKLCLFFSITILIIDAIGIASNAINLYIASGNRFRCYFGFKHPSYFSIHYITILFSLWLLYFKDKTLLSIFCFEFSGLFLWLVPNTRASSIILLLMPIILFVSKLVVEKNINICYYLFCSLPIIFLILSVLFTFCFNYDFLPKTISIRFSQALNYYNLYGIHLFKSSKMWLDNSYLFLLEHFGTVLTALYLFVFIKTIIKSIKNKNYYILSLSVALLIYSMVDNYVLNPRYNLSLFYLFANSNFLDKQHN